MSPCTPRIFVWNGGIAPLLLYFGSVCRWMISCISRSFYPHPPSGGNKNPRFIDGPSAVDKIRPDRLPCAVSALRYLRPFVLVSVIMSPSVSRFLRIISNQSAASFHQNQDSWDVIKPLSFLCSSDRALWYKLFTRYQLNAHISLFT